MSLKQLKGKGEPPFRWSLKTHTHTHTKQYVSWLPLNQPEERHTQQKTLAHMFVRRAWSSQSGSTHGGSASSARVSARAIGTDPQKTSPRGVRQMDGLSAANGWSFSHIPYFQGKVVLAVFSDFKQGTHVLWSKLTTLPVHGMVVVPLLTPYGRMIPLKGP